MVDICIACDYDECEFGSDFCAGCNELMSDMEDLGIEPESFLD